MSITLLNRAVSLNDRAQFVAKAAGARKQMLETSIGYDADEFHIYVKNRAAGKNPEMPKVRNWRE